MKEGLRILWREQRCYRLQERCNVKEVCFRERKDPSEKNYRNLCKASESNDRSYQESSSYRTYAIYSRVIRYKNKKSGVRTRLLKGAHESALFFLEDTITSVKISKVDIADGEELEGATIQLIDKDKCRGGALRL